MPKLLKALLIIGALGLPVIAYSDSGNGWFKNFLS